MSDDGGAFEEQVDEDEDVAEGVVLEDDRQFSSSRSNGDDDDDDDEDSDSTCKMIGFCCSPCILLACVILIGWNEKRSVCTAKAASAGQAVVKEVGCQNTMEGSGELVMFSCQLEEPPSPFIAEGIFRGIQHKGYCLATKSSIFQCIEKKEKREEGMPQKYSYTKDWDEKVSPIEGQLIDYSGVCGISYTVPLWPLKVPRSGEQRSEKAYAGKWELDADSVGIDCSAVQLGASVPVRNYVYNSGMFESTSPSAPQHHFGATRVAITGDKPGIWVTVLMKNGNGKLEPWKTSSSWLCSGDALSVVRTGKFTKDELFESLRSENSALTWVLRILFWLFLWGGCTLLGGPLEVAADCVPCIGPCLGDFVEAVVCCVTCLPSLACCMFVAGVVWVAMRPLVGATILIIGLVGVIVAVTFGCMRGGKKKGRLASKFNDPKPGKPIVDHIPSNSVGRVCLAPVDEPVARDFIQALRDEYLSGNNGAVGNFFDNLGEADLSEKLAPYEERVRDADDMEEAVQKIMTEWDMVETE
eukprot:TRINITY_DN23590_c0_g1_i1.p1 TRINITY_DN23590_c0_g1~~TRINITY_DN23590_c0_g1_i1.p1  ORF type:complete len:527 (-),score=74.28 TRINITY_DN23590_c0_g1_i1:357-1937(-)